MALAPALLAAALALGMHAGMEVGTADLEHPGSPDASTTSITVAPSTGDPLEAVTIVVRVTSSARLPRGRVTVRDGASTVAEALPLVRGTASFTTNGLGPGQHDLIATFLGDPHTASSVSLPVPAEYGTPAAVDAGTVSVAIPRGALTLTQLSASAATGRRDRSGVVDVMITDTRAGDLGFTVSAAASECSGRLHLAAQQVVGNALRARDVRLFEVALDPRLQAPRAVARYPAGLSTGATHLHGLLTATGRATLSCPFPRAGAATLTLTAM